MKNTYLCNNCGHIGHLSNECQLPIMSIGVILVKKNKNNDYEFLMIRRKDTFGYVDFLRGKYTFNNFFVLQNMINELTNTEKDIINDPNFIQIMTNATKNKKIEDSIIKKWHTLRNGFTLDSQEINLDLLLKNSNTSWHESEWGFPKGRRNYQEKDLDCALREFEEETGIKRENINLIENVLPIEEVFIGSNLKSYKHKYYIAFVENDDDINLNNYQKSEVSKIEWKTYFECLQCIRSYNLEKKQIIENLYKSLQEYNIIY
tara:strand:- start:819 stop:1601 length:783 start_codon:yes stop_codon:yes gene_type:complete